MSSSRSFALVIFSSILSSWMTTSTCLSLTACFMVSRHVPSTTLNRRPSSGICAIMSGELKMGSRYSHVACTFSHASRMSCSLMRVAFHSFISSSNGLTKGEPSMVCVLTIWSSSSIWISSTEDRMVVPVSL